VPSPHRLFKNSSSAIADVSAALVSAVGGYPTSAGKPAAYGILAAFDVPALPGFPSIICKGLVLCWRS